MGKRDVVLVVRLERDWKGHMLRHETKYCGL